MICEIIQKEFKKKVFPKKAEIILVLKAKNIRNTIAKATLN
jgi:hypothetical protein